nr:hypothetical protein [Tanacetum cinerariifolium]
ARRVIGRIKCNLTGHMYRAKAQVVPSLARERNQKYNYPPPHSEKVGCVLSWNAFSLGLRCAQLKTFLLRFSKDRFCQTQNSHCVLSTSKILHFVSKVLRFDLKDLAFCLDTTTFSEEQFVAFCADCDLFKIFIAKFILTDPYKPTTILVQAVEATDDSPAILEHTTVETPMYISPENKAHFLAEKEAIHLILTGIGDEIYSTVDACQTAQEMWEAIERLQQRESLNIQDVKINLFWNFEWSRFMTIVKQQHKLDEVSNHKLFDILKKYQKEVNELRAERFAREANPLALVATTQVNQDPYYQISKSHKSYAPSSKPSIPTRSHTTTRYKGNEIVKPITSPSEIASEEDSDPKQAQRDKDIQKNLDLIAKYFKKIYKPTNNNLRTSSNSRNKIVDMTPRFKNDNQSGQFGNQRTVNAARAREKVGSPVVQQSGIQCFNCKEFRHFAKECRKPKRVKDFVYHTEKMLLCKQAEQGVPLQAKQYDTDEEVDEQELEAHFSYMAMIQEVPTAETGTDSKPVEHVQNNDGDNVFANDLQHFEQSESVSNTCLVETDDSNVIPDCRVHS